jgi:prefoldin subunit 5
MLKAQAEELQSSLEDINKRISELESSAKKEE